MSETPEGYLANGVQDAAYRRVLEHEHRARMQAGQRSELTQAVAEADAMEDALAAPLFDGVREDVDAVLDGRGGEHGLYRLALSRSDDSEIADKVIAAAVAEYERLTKEDKEGKS